MLLDVNWFRLVWHHVVNFETGRCVVVVTSLGLFGYSAVSVRMMRVKIMRIRSFNVTLIRNTDGNLVFEL